MEDNLSFIVQYLDEAFRQIGDFPSAIYQMLQAAPNFVLFGFVANIFVFGFISLCRFVFDR